MAGRYCISILATCTSNCHLGIQSMHLFIFMQSHKHLNAYLYTIRYLWVIRLFTVHVSLQQLVSTQLTFELHWQLAGHNFRPCAHVNATCLTTGFTYSTCRCYMYTMYVHALNCEFTWQFKL